MHQAPEVVDGVAIQVVGDVVVILWKAPACADGWQRQVQCCEAVADAYPSGALCLDLILSGSTAPDSALRAQMQDDFRRMGGRLRRLVVVPLGDSTWLSLVRIVVRAILLVSGRSKQHVITSTAAEGIDAVLEVKSAHTPSREQLHKVVRDLFRALEIPQQSAAVQHSG